MPPRLSIRCLTVFLLGCGALSSGCGPSAFTPTVPDRVALARTAAADELPALVRPKSVILFAIDGTRWQDIFSGPDPAMLAKEGTHQWEDVSAEELTPNLHRLIERGVALGNRRRYSYFDASGPNFVSLPGYAEMLSGRSGLCENNGCTKRPESSLADLFRAEPNVRETDVAVISSWESIAIVAARDPMRVFVSCGRTHGDTRFDVVGDPLLEMFLTAGSQMNAEPGDYDYRPDVLTGVFAREYFKRNHPRFIFVGLGDTDEHGHAGNYVAYLTALHRADVIVGELVREAREIDPDPRSTLFLVTADHGRGDNFRDHGKHYPSSQGSFLIAEGGPVPPRGELGWTAPHRLRDIGPTIREMAGMAADPDENAGKPMGELFPPYFSLRMEPLPPE